MGYTTFTVEKLQAIIDKFKPKKVMDLGAQNLYNQPNIPAPYANEFYEPQNILYSCIDLSNENNSLLIDLSKPLTEIIYNGYFDLVVDSGTSEHVSDEQGKFSWESIYNCWKIKHDLLNVTGVMYSENPKTGNWPEHGRQYFTKEFYYGMISLAGYELLDIGEHAACNNIIDGWNIYCTMRKISNKFPTIEEFKTLDLRQS